MLVLTGYKAAVLIQIQSSSYLMLLVPLLVVVSLGVHRRVVGRLPAVRHQSAGQQSPARRRGGQSAPARVRLEALERLGRLVPRRRVGHRRRVPVSARE